MKRRRDLGVIDVNREWNVHSGTRTCGRWIGRVLGHDYRTSLDNAQARWPNIRLWIEDKAEDDARVMRAVARDLQARSTIPTYRSNHHG